MKEWLDLIDSEYTGLSKVENISAREETIEAILDVIIRNVPAGKKSEKMKSSDGSTNVALFRNDLPENMLNGYVAMLGGFQIKGRDGYICYVGTDPRKRILIAPLQGNLRSLTEKEAQDLKDIFQSLQRK